MTSAEFWARVDKNGPIHPILGTRCWLYTGRIEAKGYGRASRILAHRFAWIEAEGSIPEGLHVLHHCDNPPCVNRAHLFVGTNDENAADCVAKGRRKKGPGPGRFGVGHRLGQLCKNGHEFTEANTYRFPNRSRRCRECFRLWTANWRRQKKAQ